MSGKMHQFGQRLHLCRHQSGHMTSSIKFQAWPGQGCSELGKYDLGCPQYNFIFKSKLTFVWVLHSCLHLFSGERKESVSMTSLLSSTFSYLNLATSCFRNYIWTKLYNSQPFSFGLFFFFFWQLKPRLRGVCFYSHMLIFFSKVNSHGVYHVFKGSINYIEEHAKSDEES